MDVLANAAGIGLGQLLQATPMARLLQRLDTLLHP
jgi:hypothetical protein